MEEDPTRPRSHGSRVDDDRESDEFLTLLSHELRNPLATINGWATILRDAQARGDQATVQRAIAGVEKGSRRLGALLSAIERSGSIARTDEDLHLEEVLISSLVQDVVTDVEMLTSSHFLNVTVDDDIVLHIDADRIRQVLTNLVSNAVKFSPQQTGIHITISREDGDIAISVADEGKGIPPERTQELFQKFSRLDAPESGTGLGLYVSRTIARAHGGDLVLSGDAASGCTFKLTLPLR